MKHLFLLILCGLFCYITAYPAKTKNDTTYYKPSGYKNDIRLTYGFNSQYIDLYSTSKKRNGDHIYFAPNINSNAKITLNLRFLSLSYSTLITNRFIDTEKYGTTTFNDVSIAYTRKFIGLDFFYKKYNGLYSADLIHSNVISRPDASLYSIGGNLLMIISGDRFSYNAAYNQTMIQNKRAGSLIALASYSKKTWGGKYSLLPPELDSTVFFGQYTGIKNIEYSISSLSPGYAYIFVTKNNKWFISPMLTSGIGIANYKFLSISGEGTTQGLYWDLNFKISAGYNHKNLFMSLYFDSRSNNNYLSETVVLNNTLVSFFITVGFRFKANRQ
jgi:hypothetical protein